MNGLRMYFCFVCPFMILSACRTYYQFTVITDNWVFYHPSCKGFEKNIKVRYKYIGTHPHANVVTDCGTMPCFNMGFRKAVQKLFKPLGIFSFRDTSGAS